MAPFLSKFGVSVTKHLKLKNLKPFSINTSYYASRNGRVKTSEFREWQAEVFFQLARGPNRTALEDLRTKFDPKKHEYHVHMIAYYPRPIFYTKEGTISAKTLDITNCEKSLVDSIFLCRYHDAPAPYGCPNLNADDKYLTKIVSEKRISHDGEYKMHVHISLKSRCQK